MKLGNTRLAQSTALPAVLLFIIFTSVNTALSPSFMTIRAWEGFLQSTVPVVLLSFGEALVIIGGGIDISVGSVVSLVNTIMATVSSTDGPVGLPIIVSLAVALSFGLLNGFLVGYLRITPLLATFATSFIGNGLALTILPTPGGTVPGVLSDLYYMKLLNFLPMPLVLAIVVLIIWGFLRRSTLGLSIYATGHNAEKAYFSGQNVIRAGMFTYVFSALVAGIAGIAASSNFGAGDPRVGMNMTLTSVAACVIGGVSLAGGSGTLFGAALGSIVLYEIIVTILGLGIPGYYQDLANGLVVMGGIALAVLARRREREAY
jgi:ribose transport system permease protein